MAERTLRYSRLRTLMTVIVVLLCMSTATLPCQSQRNPATGSAPDGRTETQAAPVFIGNVTLGMVEPGGGTEIRVSVPPVVPGADLPHVWQVGVSSTNVGSSSEVATRQTNTSDLAATAWLPLLTSAPPVASPLDIPAGVWVPLEAPTRGIVHMVEPAPSDPTVLYAGTEAGVYKSTDRGATWARAGLNSPETAFVFDLAVDPHNPDNVYAADWGGLHHSTDGGWSWRVVLVNNSWFRAVEYDRRIPGYLYAIDFHGRFFRSTDAGATWNEMSFLIDWTNSMVSSTDGQLYVSTNACAGGFWQSRDQGMTWELKDEKIPGSSHLPDCGVVERFAIDPWQPNVIFARGFGVFKSTDHGDSWTLVSETMGNNLVGIDPLLSGYVYAIDIYFQLVRSRDAGLTWETASQGYPVHNNSSSRMTTFMDGNTPVLAAATDVGVWQSEDHADTWVETNVGLGVADVQALAVAPSNPQIVFAGTKQGGVFKSVDGGRTWQDASQGIPLGLGILAHDLAVDARNPYLVYLNGWGIQYRTTDGGQNWQETGRAATACLIADPKVSGVAYIGDWQAVQKTIDGGLTWEVYSMATEGYVLDLAISRQDASKLYAATWDGIHRSLDGGQTWERVGTGLPEGGWMSVAVDPQNDAIVYAGSSSKLGWIYKSLDSGATWAPANAGFTPRCNRLVTGILVDPADSQRVFVSVGRDRESWMSTRDDYCGGLFQSRDGGATWSAMPMAFPNSDFFFQRLALDCQRGTLFAGSANGGVWAYRIDR